MPSAPMRMSDWAAEPSVNWRVSAGLKDEEEEEEEEEEYEESLLAKCVWQFFPSLLTSARTMAGRGKPKNPPLRTSGEEESLGNNK